MTICLKVLAISSFILFATSQVDISRWKHYQKVATLSSKEEVVLSHSRVNCAALCEYRNCDSFVYGYDKRCQTLRGQVDELQKGEQYEHWMRSDPKTPGSIAGTLFVYNENYLYWFDISTRERIAKAKHQDDVTHCIYDTKRRIFYWCETWGPMKWAKLSLGKAGRAKRILRWKLYEKLGENPKDSKDTLNKYANITDSCKPVGHFCIDFDQEIIFYSKAPANANGDFMRYSRKTREQKVLVKQRDNFRMWCCSVDPPKQYLFYGVTDEGIRRIDYNGGDERFIERTDPNTIFFNEYDQNLYWVEEYDSDEEDELSRINYRKAYGTSVTKQMDLYMDQCYSIYVLQTVIYYKTDTARGVSVVTLDGTPLPAIGAMEISSDEEPYIFLFK